MAAAWIARYLTRVTVAVTVAVLLAVAVVLTMWWHDYATNPPVPVVTAVAGGASQ